MKTTVILLLIFIRGATKNVNDIMENNVTAKTEERRRMIARVRSGPKLAHLGKASKLAHLGKEAKLAHLGKGAKLAHLGKEARVVNALRESQEGCPPRLAEFLV